MKRMKYMVVTVALAALLFCGVTPCLYSVAAATAETTSVENTEMVETPENTDDTTLDEPSDEKESVKDITLPVLCGVTGLSGVALLYLLFKGKLKKIGTAFESIVSWFREKKEEVTTEELDLKKIEQEFASAVETNETVKELLQQAYERNREEYDTLCCMIKETMTTAVDMVGEMKACYENRATTLERQYEQIKTILRKITAGSSELVRRGVADEVVELIENDVATKGVKNVG